MGGKTGTTNDYRDAWAVGFNHLYTVGIWMGNLDGHATGGLTSSTGPGLILRSVFAELNRFLEAQPLYRPDQRAGDGAVAAARAPDVGQVVLPEVA